MFERAKDLRILNQAEKIADDIWEIVINWSYFAKDTIGKQLICASDSIGANITEGYSRYHLKEGLNFYYYARASLEETEYWLRRAINRKLIKSQDYEKFLERLENLLPQLNSFISKKRISK
ncbi:MAG: four helix bundle protein [Candidatus Omnitrophica bacterium]|nr:four helix bundle protein [Candidatus Omnitrophota bacterium]